MIGEPHQVLEFVRNAQEYQFRLLIIRGIMIGSVILLALAALGLLYEDYFND